MNGRLFIITVTGTETLPIAIAVGFSKSQLSRTGIIKPITDLDGSGVGQCAEIIAVTFTAPEAIHVLITLICAQLSGTGVINAITQLGSTGICERSFIVTVVTSTHPITIKVDDVGIISLTEAVAVTVHAITDLSKPGPNLLISIIAVPSTRRGPIPVSIYLDIKNGTIAVIIQAIADLFEVRCSLWVLIIAVIARI